eukprot:TRINITY_DN2973_c0_g1_i2.p1 TRINITY_DN2973_c0_g1~~TRINITY_DN2973_c0_g1_i2.p1  ORF type:complete len:914 (-),score=376.02 TRINITY_DN2973_c0_g1_i2:347-3025(-)
MGRKKKGGDDYWDGAEELTEESLEAQAELADAKRKEKKEVTKKEEPTPAPVETKKETTTTAPSKNSSAGGKKNAAKKEESASGEKESTTTPAVKGSKKEEPKKKKAGGISGALAAAIRAKQEEEEKKRQIEEERRKKEEEEEELRRIEEEKEEELLRQKKEIKKQKDKEKKLAKEAREQEEKLALARARLGVANLNVGEETEKPKKMLYGVKKKNKDKKEKEAAAAKAKEEEEKNKEDEVLDDWENALDSDEEKAEEPKKEVVAPVSQNKEEKKPEPVKQSKKEEKQEEEEDDDEGLRSPICCVLGHVDTGKTKLLDKIRRTNVQLGEAGGITQQIGATFFPMDKLRDLTNRVKNAEKMEVKVPGLLIIDTPGHESFSNLRSRGNALCDIAVLVQDITAGKIEKQTLESLNMLKKRKTPFIIALNKVDRIFQWVNSPNAPIQDALKKQEQSALIEFEDKVKIVKTIFAEQGLNAELYYRNKDHKKVINIVPTSAITGEGIPDMLMLLVALTQKLLTKKLLSISKLQCTVLEVKMTEGLGCSIDVILVNGTLREGDKIVVCGLNGPIVTNIRALLTPESMKEMRVKSQFVHHKVIHASQGVKISAPDLEHAIAGSPLLVCGPDDDLEELKEEVMKDLEALTSKIRVQKVGVFVQASTLGSLEALLEFLHTSKIPVAGINVGPISKKHVTAASVMLDKHKEYAVMLAFNVKLDKEVAEYAEKIGVRIFSAEIIYHLFDQFTAYMEQFNAAQQEAAAPVAVFPCRLKLFPEYIFNKANPIVIGVEVTDGTLRLGTPLCVPGKDFCFLGRATGIEKDKKALTEAKQSSMVALKIEIPENMPNTPSKIYGRHFDHNDEIVSQISRESIDALKVHFKDQVTTEDVRLLAKLKGVFNIK